MAKYQYSQEAWLLNDLFPGIDAPEIERALTVVGEQIVNFEGWRSKLDSDLNPGDFVKVLQDYEGIVRGLYRLLGFAVLSYSADTATIESSRFCAD